MSYTFALPRDATVTWNDKDNQANTDTVQAGQVVEIDDPCDAYPFITAYLAKTGVKYRSGGSGSRLSTIRAACRQKPSPATVIGQTADAPAPAADPVPAEPGNAVGTQPPPNNPPVETATPEAVDVPTSPPLVQATPSPPVVGVPDGRPVEERAHDPLAPLTDADITDELRSSGDPSDLVTRVRHNEPTPGLPHYDFGVNDEPRPHAVTEPVDLFGGAFLIEELDVQIPGRVRPLQLVRRYRSGVPYFGPWGFNWDHNYNAYLRPLDDNWVAVWTGLLNEDVYEPDPALGWKPPLGVTARLEHFPADALSNERWVVTAADGTAYRFEQPPGWPRPDRLPLIEIRDRFDNLQSLSYDSEGRLDRVVDDLGHYLAFGYGDCGLLEELTDSAGRRWQFIHDDDREHLAAVIQPGTDEAPDGTVTQYEYDIAELHGRLRHNIVRVLGPDGCTKVENEYGKDPATDDFGRVVEQRYGPHHAAFRATVLATPSRLPDAIDLPAVQVESIIDGDYRVETFNFRGGRLEERYRLVRDSSYRLVVEAYRYDEHGNLTLHRRPNGMTTRYVHDVANADPQAWANLLEIWLDAPPSRPAISRRVARMRYEPKFQLLSRHRDESGAETLLHYGHESAPAGPPALERVEHPDATLPDGTTQPAETTYTFNARGQITSETSAEGRRVEYEYGTAGNDNGYLVARIRDPNGIAAADRFTYDAQGNARAVTDGEGATTDFTFDARNRLVQATKPDAPSGPAVLRLRYHLDGELAELRRPRGLATGLPIGETEIVTLCEYDVLGRITRQLDGANADAPRERRYEYDGLSRITATTDALGRRNELEYDERGGVLTQTRVAPDGTRRTLRLIRDLNGGVRTSILPGGQRIDWRLDSWDRVRRQEEPAYADGRLTIESAYGDDDLLVRRRLIGPDGLGAATAVLGESTYGFDERGRLISEDHGIGAQTTVFDADGLPIHHIDPSGAQVDHDYDDLARLRSVTDPLGNTTAYVYDRVDRLLEELVTEPTAAGPVTHRERRSYDARGDQLDFIDALGRQTRYDTDAAGQLVAMTDPIGTRTELLYNPFAELVVGRAFLGAGTIEHQIERDGAGRATTLIDPSGAAWHTELDGFDQPLKHVTPDGREERLTYGADGALLRMELPGGSRVDYGRRADGALATVDFTAAGGSLATPQVSFVRDGLGRLISATQAASVVERRYDPIGRVTEERNDGVSLQHDWQDSARLERITYSDGRIDRREHDALGRLERIVLESPGTATATSAMHAGDVLCDYGYEGQARLVSRTLSNGATLRARYDAAQRLVELAHVDGAGNTIVRLEYVVDGAGRRRLVAVTGPPWSDHAYDYDELGRLVTSVAGAQHAPLPNVANPVAVDAFLAAAPAVPAGDVTDVYTLGDADTRDAWTRTDAVSAAARTYSYDAAHRLTDLTVNGATTAIKHDTDGRRRADDRWRYRHDVLGRLREVIDPFTGTTQLDLSWDPLGRLRAIRRPSGELITLRYLEDHVLEREHGSGTLTQETHGALPGEIPLRVDPSDLLFRAQDHTGSTLALVDGGGTTVERHRHDDFGEVTGWDGAGGTLIPLTGLASPVLFGGLEYLPDVGLYIAGERAYDPGTGLFIQPDPLGVLDSANPYLYAKHDPINQKDGSGLIIESAWDVFSIGVGVASLSYNLTRDKIDWWAVGLDVGGILVDTAALLIPGVPGGAGALIKASRAAKTGAQIVTQSTKVGRAIRYTQAGVGVGNAVRGGFQSYEAVREGRYGAAAIGFGFSALGIRGGIGRIASARAATRVPTTLYSLQGNMADIRDSGVIWAKTEGRVWATPDPAAGPAKIGMFASELPEIGERVLFEFTGEAAKVFRPQAVWGIFSGWKALAGQHVTELGDLHLNAFSTPAFGAASIANRSRVFEATHAAGQFGAKGMSLAYARWRASFPIWFDTGVNVVLAGTPGLLGLIRGQHPPAGELRPRLTPDVPPSGQVTKPQK